MKRKIYTLKPWDAVVNHHFITKDAWNKLVSVGELEVREFNHIFVEDVLIAPKGTTPEFGVSYLVSTSDLDIREVEVAEEVRTPDPADTPKEKTYTKDELRKFASATLSNLGANNDITIEMASISALAISKFINELN